MGYLEGYIAEEQAAEYKAGFISYAELLRRLTYLTGTVLAALALEVTLGCAAQSTPAPQRFPVAIAQATPTAINPVTSDPPTSTPLPLQAGPPRLPLLEHLA